MAKLEDLTPNASIRGILPDSAVTVQSVQWHGSEALELTYKDAGGQLGNELLYRHDEPRLELVETGRPWGFDGDGALFRLVSEAYRIRLAHLFDPVMAVHTSNVQPLPHQITAVYEAMLPRQPLRFVLADDPGAGKTIMAGLLIRELLMRGDAPSACSSSPPAVWSSSGRTSSGTVRRRAQPVRPSSPRPGRTPQRLRGERPAHRPPRQLARNEDLQAKLQSSEWDLIVVDEAHKMSATFFGNKVNKTKRFKLGSCSAASARHFLLMTATPHNGKEEDFQIWLALLDGDRFYGKFREGAHKVDVSDMMRRMVKEDLLKFDGTPLFPERRAYTAPTPLGTGGGPLQAAVTDYVRNEFNRAAELCRRQAPRHRRLCPDPSPAPPRLQPEAIYQSLKRRRKKLESRLREEKLRAARPPGRRDPGHLQRQRRPDNIDDLEDERPAARYEGRGRGSSTRPPPPARSRSWKRDPR
jgi:hypothetical protein